MVDNPWARKWLDGRLKEMVKEEKERRRVAKKAKPPKETAKTKKAKPVKTAKRTMTMEELKLRLSGCSVRQLIVAMRLMRPDKDTLGFDYSKIKKDELMGRALTMAEGLDNDRREKVSRLLDKAFGWKAGDLSGKASDVGGARGEESGPSRRYRAGTGGDDYGTSGHAEEMHGPHQGGSGKEAPSQMTKEAIEEAVKKLMEQRTDELMSRLSKTVFTIEVESPDGEGENKDQDQDQDQDKGGGGQKDGEQSEESEGEASESGEGQEEGKQGEGDSKKEGKGGKGKNNKKKKRTVEAGPPRHEVFQEVCQAVNKGLNVLLVGPAGCGKTHMAQDIAQVLSLPFKFTGAVSSEYKLLGFITAHGTVVRTEYREAYENGGLFLWDELDGSSAQALLSFNAGLSNGHQDFPDKVVEQHKMFRAVASANTYGNGADRMYIGRNQLDAASLDRFYVVPMDYDEQLECALYGRSEWVTYVQGARQAMRSIGGIRHVISMRAIQMGLKMQSTGVSREQIERACLWRHLQQDDVEKIKWAMRK